MSILDLFAWPGDFSGKSIVDFILAVAGTLTEEDMPGWVSLALVVALVVLSLWYLVVTGRFIGAVRSVRVILRVEDGNKITRSHLLKIDRELSQARTRGSFYRQLESAWREFNETALQPLTDSGGLRNTERPVVFFNREDLGLEAGIWRQVPALFVSIGLLLTFLGLVCRTRRDGQGPPGRLG